MKSKRLFQLFVLFALLFSPFGANQSARASTSSAEQPDIQVVDHDLINWGPNYSYTGNVSPGVYENWRFTLPADRKFTMKVTSVVGDLVPLLILLDSHGNELTRDLYILTSTQPAGDYSIRVQPQSGQGDYHFTIEEILQNQPTVSLVVSSPSIDPGETATVMVKLDNVPTEGYTSMELTCGYYPNLVEATDIVVADLFGTNPVTAIHGPQHGLFIVAIAGSHGHKVTGSGTVMTFNVRGMQAGQSPMECQARVSTGDNALTKIASVGNNIIVLAPTPTSVSGLCDHVEFIADINVPPGTVMSPGAAFRKTWRLKNVGSCSWTASYRLVFFSGDPMGTPQSLQLPVNVPPGVTVDISLFMTAPSAPGAYRGYWMFQNVNGALFGSGPQANEPWFVDIVVAEVTVTPGPTLTQSPTAPPVPEVGTLTGQVHVAKPVTLSLYRDNAILVTSAIADADGTFSFTVPVGAYLVVARADGFLGAEGMVTIPAGNTITLPVISLPAGDIDGNSRIDPFDVLTIGINYNNALPSVADLNNDGIINVMDLELLAMNYRKAGLVPWNDYE